MKLVSLPSTEDKSLFLQTMIESYLDTALWVQFDTEENINKDNLSLDAKMQAIQDCSNFLHLLNYDVKHIDSIQMGHDFFLTRNRQGAGFWDRDNGDFGILLTDLSHKFTEFTPIIGDDGLVYFE
jgi:hypothetical protein